MPIPIAVSGLSQVVPELPPGTLVLLEGDVDPVKTIFAIKLGYSAAENGRSPVYVSSRHPGDVEQDIARFAPEQVFSVVDGMPQQWGEHIAGDSFLVIDSFSYLVHHVQISEYRGIVEDIYRRCKQCNGTAALLIDTGMLERQAELLIEHLADAIIRFRSRETSEGKNRYMEIPKWVNGQTFDRNIYYTLDDIVINVDLRSRLV